MVNLGTNLSFLFVPAIAGMEVSYVQEKIGFTTHRKNE